MRKVIAVSLLILSFEVLGGVSSIGTLGEWGLSGSGTINSSDYGVFYGDLGGFYGEMKCYFDAYTFTAGFDGKVNVDTKNASTANMGIFGEILWDITSTTDRAFQWNPMSYTVMVKKGCTYAIRFYAQNVPYNDPRSYSFSLYYPDRLKDLAVSYDTMTCTAFGTSSSVKVSSLSSWTASVTSASSWLTITSGKSGGKGIGWISWKVESNPEIAKRDGVITVTNGAQTKTVKFTQEGKSPSRPDLLPYTPTGWSGPLVVSASSSSTTSDSSFKTSDTLYMSFAVVCQYKNITSGFKTTLFVDGSPRCDFTTSSLQAGYYASKHGYSIGMLTAGSHTLKIAIDSDGVITEENEDNNSCSKTITVVAPTQTYDIVYRPGNYGIGTQQTATKTKGIALMLKGAIFTRTGYVQSGWSKNLNGSTRDYELSALYITDTALTLYPYWTQDVAYYTMTFDANGGTGEIAPILARRVCVYKLPKSTLTPPKDKSRFVGWRCSNGRRYDDEMLVFGLGNVTMTAIWE